MTSLEVLVDEIRGDRARRVVNFNPRHVPGFDPNNGNENARYLLLLEAPGPRAVDSGVVSFDNDDPTAGNLKGLLEHAKIGPAEVVIWNIVPWYLGDERGIREAGAEDIREGKPFLFKLLEAIPNLESIVLLGGKAREAHLSLSQFTPARILTCHHPSARGQAGARRKENEAVFRMLVNRRGAGTCR